MSRVFQGSCNNQEFFLKSGKWFTGTRIMESGGLGRDRTGDLTIFSRSLVPTELPSQTRF